MLWLGKAIGGQLQKVLSLSGETTGHTCCALLSPHFCRQAGGGAAAPLASVAGYCQPSNKTVWSVWRAVVSQVQNTAECSAAPGAKGQGGRRL